MRVYLWAAIASTGGLLFGFNTGIIAGVLPQLQHDWGISPAQAGLIISSILGGAVIGAAICGKIADYVGRRDIIMAMAGMFVLGSFSTGLTNSPETFIIGRVIIGMALGAISLAVPLYISEIAPARIRGRLVTINQLAITCGILISYIVSLHFSFFPQGWRYMLIVGTIPGLFLSFAALFLTESPRWLLLHRDEDEARLVFKQLGAENIDAEIAEIKSVIADSPKDAWAELAKPNVRSALALAVGVFFIQQFVGINAVIYNAPAIFQLLGYSDATARLLAAFGIGAINVTMTLLAMVLIDKIGRKLLLQAGLVGMAVSLFALGLSTGYLDYHDPVSQYISVISLVVYIISFAFSFGPVAWVTVAEIFPLHIRGLAMSIPVACHWIFNIIISAAAVFFLDDLKNLNFFDLFALVAVGGWFYIKKYFKEDKGLSLEAIQKRYLDESKARPPSRFIYYIMSTVAAMGGFLTGYNFGIIAGALVFITAEWQLTAVDQGVLVSSVIAGAFFGTLAAGKASDIFGRRYLLMSTAAVYVGASFYCGLAPSFSHLVAGRVIVGFAMGVSSIAAAIYVTEISPPEIRGKLLTIDHLAVAIGILAAYFTNLIFEPVEHGWRYMFAIIALPSAVYGFCLLFLPESPRWLISRKRISGSYRMLRKLGVENPEEMVRELSLPTDDDTDASWTDLFKTWVRPPFFIGVVLMFIVIFTGFDCVILYAPTIFESVGFPTDATSILATFGLGAVNLVLTFLSIKYVDSVNRKTLLNGGLIVMSISLVTLGVILTHTPIHLAWLRWVLLSFFAVYVGGFALTLGPVTDVIVSEIYPQNIRGVAIGVVWAINKFFAIMFSLTFPVLMKILGLTVTFWMYAAIGVAGFAFCYFYLPETKGKTLEEIELYWRNNYSAREK